MNAEGIEKKQSWNDDVIFFIISQMGHRSFDCDVGICFYRVRWGQIQGRVTLKMTLQGGALSGGQDHKWCLVTEWISGWKESFGSTGDVRGPHPRVVPFNQRCKRVYFVKVHWCVGLLKESKEQKDRLYTPYPPFLMAPFTRLKETFLQDNEHSYPVTLSFFLIFSFFLSTFILYIL